MICVLMGGAFEYLSSAGSHVPAVVDWGAQMPKLMQVFIHSTFAFVYHYAVPSIVYTVRPQVKVGKMFMWANIVGAFFLCLEAIVAWVAFGSLTNSCKQPADWSTTHPDEAYPYEFPCAISDQLQNNFMALSIGPVVALYPMLNVSVVAVLNISLRNNLFDASPIRAIIQKRESCTWMLQDHRP